MTGSAAPFALVLHGGAGVEPGRNYDRADALLGRLILNGERRLRAGDSALDVVTEAVVEMEESGLFVAGRGAAPNTLGRVELDASLMDGRDGRCGAVAALQGVRSPILAARAVMEQSSHVLMAGDGAARFALDRGLAASPPLADWLRRPDGFDPADLHKSHGTVGAAALDQHGGQAAATSTGGTYDALPGRVGDSAVIGAGTWADQHAAISCTGEGEAFIRVCAARSIAARIAAGEPPGRAVEAVLEAVSALGGDGGVILVTAGGAAEMRFNTPGMKRALVSFNQTAVTGTIGEALRPARP